ncbi:hypothetical protein [Qipengyuania nanhaisediminis]|uniref:Uncharacterized protein n=1 Tax=Qipengyuania nanhaisediminis TaxID=604088 RepID=A0A1I5MDX6_9SPHN|nr:hypothetical protein [Qipengyuania nanhaisediminis]SFP07729.1 hypothetical protein SAMN04488060_1302 [Qipengyuania nanhaisediminis]
MAKKPCRIHYRRLSREEGAFPDETLSDRIAAALEADGGDGSKIKEHVKHRTVNVPTQPEYQRALNNFAVDDTYVFGTTCLFAPGQMQALLKLADDDAQPELEAVLEAYEIAEQAAPEGHEYLHGLSYWLAVGDHFYQIQSASLQVGAMEQYLTWLLASKANVIGAEHYVQLQALFDQDQLADDEPTFIQVGGIVPETLHADPPQPEDPANVIEVEEREKLGGGALGWAKSREILNDLYGALKAQELIDAVPDEAALEVLVSIGYRAKKRKIQKNFMKDLASGLRNLPDGEVTVRTKSGTSKGADARLFQDMGITKVDGASGLLVLEDARDQMLEVHRRFLHDGKITP